MIKGYKIRIYPTKSQEEALWNHINCCRYIYNWMVTKQEERFQSKEKHLSQFQMINLLKPLKNDGNHSWLYDVSNTSLQLVCGDVNMAYQRYFNGQNRKPTFKIKKGTRQGYPVRSESFYFKTSKLVNIEKIGKVKYKTDFSLPIGTKCKFSNPRVSYYNNKWLLSFGVECDNQTSTLNSYRMGIDLGIKESAVVAYNDNQKLVFHNINKGKTVRALMKKIKYLHRAISRKYEANKVNHQYIKTKNIEKLEQQVRKLYARISHIRNNFIHQSTHTLVSLLPSVIVVEDLNVRGLMKNRYLSKAIQDQCLGEWIRQIRYKSEWKGITFIQASKWFPSSKTCHRCGHINKDLKLKDRVYICSECGYTEDRDYNAALNLMSYEG